MIVDSVDIKLIKPETVFAGITRASVGAAPLAPILLKNHSTLMSLLLLCAKVTLSALATVRCRYQLFAGLNPHQHFTLASFLLPLDKLPQG